MSFQSQAAISRFLLRRNAPRSVARRFLPVNSQNASRPLFFPQSGKSPHKFDGEDIGFISAAHAEYSGVQLPWLLGRE